MTMRVLIDTRSALVPRTSGWERYARGLREVFGDDPRISEWHPPAESVLDRLKADWLTAPLQVRGFEVAHFLTFPPPLLCAVGASVSRRFPQVVYTLHDLTWWKHAEWSSSMGRYYFKPLARASIEAGAHIVTVSEAMRREVLEILGIGENHVTAIPLGAPALPVCPPATRSKPFLLAVGTIEPRKNLRRLLNAYSRWSMRQDVDLVLAGRTGWGELPAGATRLGAVSDAQLSALYNAALGLVFPSLYEGFGLPLLEAARVGLPVACSDIPAFREVALGETYFFDPMSEEDIAEGLSRLVSAAGRGRTPIHVEERFSWQRAREDLLALYAKLAGQR